MVAGTLDATPDLELPEFSDGTQKPPPANVGTEIPPDVPKESSKDVSVLSTAPMPPKTDIVAVMPDADDPLPVATYRRQKIVPSRFPTTVITIPEEEY